MIRHEAGMIAGKAIQNPIRRRHVRVIVGTVHSLGSIFIPAGPALPIEVGTVVVGWKLIWLVVEKAFPHAVFLLPILELNSAPYHVVHELLEFGHLFRI